jgi:hypothetical protein
MMKNASTSLTEYQVDISGNLENHWSDWFDGFSIKIIQNDPFITRLQGPIRDQAALRSLLEKIWDLNLVILHVERLGSINKRN